MTYDAIEIGRLEIGPYADEPASMAEPPKGSVSGDVSVDLHYYQRFDWNVGQRCAIC